MKTRRFSGILSLLFLLPGAMAFGQDTYQAEVPGDNFSLEGALELFKKSSSPEDFERMLNSPGSQVNNLDLNGDGDIDYIRVIDKTEGNIHDFILQAVISDTQSQDVAVIELEKYADGQARLQIIGDSDVYGTETIIEPTQDVKVYAGTTTAHTTVNVWAWPSVRYVYGPSYSVWVSPGYWSARPVWWHPWHPVAYYDYYGWSRPYRSYYSVCYTYRSPYAHHYYNPYRTTSVIVYNRHHDRIEHYRESHPDRDHYGYGHSDHYNNGWNGHDNSGSYDHSGRDRQNDGHYNTHPNSGGWNGNRNPSLQPHRDSRSESEGGSHQRYTENFNKDLQNSRHDAFSSANRSRMDSHSSIQDRQPAVRQYSAPSRSSSGNRSTYTPHPTIQRSSAPAGNHSATSSPHTSYHPGSSKPSGGGSNHGSGGRGRGRD